MVRLVLKEVRSGDMVLLLPPDDNLPGISMTREPQKYVEQLRLGSLYKSLRHQYVTYVVI